MDKIVDKMVDKMVDEIVDKPNKQGKDVMHTSEAENDKTFKYGPQIG